MKLPASYYLTNDVVAIAKDLIGKEIFTNINGEITSGVIIETEAYAGIHDKASHAYGSRRTKRTEVMYKPGGIAYVYLCYGIHSLFNIVCGEQDLPNAVLIRGLKAAHGSEFIRKRMAKSKFNNGMIHGPGLVTKALGIKVSHNGTELQGNTIWLEKSDFNFDASRISVTPRIGIEYASDDALLPYRFALESC
jgi:DNA-3-methyladenine glycosylase